MNIGLCRVYILLREKNTLIFTVYYGMLRYYNGAYN